MGNKIKIHEISKKRGISNKEVLERAKKLGIEATSHLSGVDEDEAKKIELSDYVIINDNRKALYPQLKNILRQLL